MEIRQRRKQVVSGTVLALMGFVTFRLVAGNRNPEIIIDWPSPPPHNAFAVYVAASKGVTPTKGLDEAYAVVIGKRDIRKQPLPVSLGALVARNQASLTLLRQRGFMQPFQTPPANGLMDDTTYLSDFHRMAFLLVTEGQVRADQGNLRGAIDSNLDAVRLGKDIARNGSLKHYAVGAICQIVGERGLWRQRKQYSAADARYALHRLEALSLRQPSLSESLEGEKRLGQTIMREMFLASSALYKTDETGPSSNPVLRWLDDHRNPLYAVWSKQTILDHYCTYMDSQIRRSRAPYDPKAPELPEPNDFISPLFTPVLSFEAARFKEISRRTQRHLLTTALALQAYQQEHNGKPPATLAELSPGYLATIPADPFAAAPNTPVRYRKETNGNRFTLYSVGPNGKDDGGKRIDNSHFLRDLAPGEKRADFVLAESEGDMVAGLNF